MEILKAYWAQEDQSNDVKSVYKYVVDLRSRLEDTCRLAQEELLKSQDIKKRIYDRTARPKKLQTGDKVLLLLPTKANKLLLQWKGPYVVTDRMSPVNYKIKIRNKEKTYHVNMLRLYHDRDEDKTEHSKEKMEDQDEDNSSDSEDEPTDEAASTIVAASLVLKDGLGDEEDTSEIIGLPIAANRDLE